MTDDDDMRAAEYVLGTLDGAERIAFERDLARDPALVAAVVEWEKRLSPLARLTPDQAPPPALFARIEAALPANDDAPGVVVALRRSVRRWRAAAATTAALAAALAVFVIDRERRAVNVQPAGVYVAAVNRGGDQPALIVRVDLATGRVFVRPVAAETPAGKSLELWYIADGDAPRSMGLVSGAGNLPLPQGARLEKAKFAVTVEPPGGSPTGSPTGPIVYAGDLVRE